MLNETRKFTPYVFAGLGYFHFNPYTYYNGQKIFLKPLSTEGEGVSGTGKKFYQLSQFDYPIGIGFKYKVSDRILLGIEFNSRLLYTDYVDDVSTRYPDETTLFKERGQLAVNLSFRGNEIDPALNFPSNTHRGNPKQKDNFYTSVFTFTYILPGHTILSGGNGWRNTRSLNCPKITH